MALTTEQLETIKTKIETDKVRPIKAIRELFPEEPFHEVRQQLFEAYDRQELLSHFTPPERPAPVEPTKEEKLERVNRQLEMMEQRKARLLKEKTDLEAE
jgi:DNA-binding transcriptional MerR regulator